MSSLRSRPSLLTLAGPLLALACGGDSGTGTKPIDTPPQPAYLAISPASPDTLAPGAKQSLTVTVYTSDSHVLTGRAITFSSTDSSVVYPDSTGLLTAGQVGTVTVSAIVQSNTGPVSASMRVIVFDRSQIGIPRHIALAQPLSSSLVVGTNTPVNVKITDIYDNPVAGTNVTFSAHDGGGSVAPTTTLTNIDGIATTTWTLGTNTSSLNVVDVRAGPVEALYNSSTMAGPPASFKMSFPFAGLTPGNDVAVSAIMYDAYGNLNGSAPVQFVIRDPSLFTNQTSPSSNAARATAQGVGQTYIVGSVGDLTDSTLVAVFPLNGVLISAPAPRFDIKADTTFATNIQISTGPTTPAIGSLTVTVTWDPTVLHYEADGPSGQTAGTVTVNRDNVANGSLTIAIASGMSIGAPASLRVITFHAASTANLHGALTVSASEISTVDFTSLLPVTQVLSFPVRTR